MKGIAVGIKIDFYFCSSFPARTLPVRLFALSVLIVLSDELTIVKSFISLSKMMMTHCQFRQIARHVQLRYQTKPHRQFMATVMILYFNFIAWKCKSKWFVFVPLLCSTHTHADSRHRTHRKSHRAYNFRVGEM